MATRILTRMTIVAALCLGWLGIQTSLAQTADSTAQPISDVDSPGKIVQVSGDDPFAGCETPASPGEINFPNTRVEPYVALSPASHNLIGIWQQDRWNSSGARGIVAGFSFDGGHTWHQTALPFSLCAPGGRQEDRASDPWVSIGPDGIAYVSAISFSFFHNDTAVTAMTSTDGGKSWQNLNAIKEDTIPPLNDKEAVTADPVKPGTAYIVWDRFGTGHGAAAWFSKTVDGGRRWSPGKVIVPTVAGEFTGGNQIVVDPTTGALYDFFGWNIPGPLNFIAFVKSTDGGETWSDLQEIVQVLAIDVTSPIAGQAIRTTDNDREHILATLRANGVNVFASEEPIRAGNRGVAVDANTGQLYVVWEDARFSGMLYDEVAITTSKDGGLTWSTPSRVNMLTGGVKFTPSVQVNRKGVVAVTYYDFRNFHGQPDTLPTDYWIIFSKDGGASFEDEDHVAGSFNMLAAPLIPGDGFFLGDYQGLGAAGNAFVPFFVQTNCLDNSCAAITGGPRPTDVYAIRIVP